MSANAEAIEAWNTVLFQNWERFRDVLAGAYAHHGEMALRRHPPAPGTRVLDIGCGYGDTTLRIAELVGPSGEAVGVDAAENFVVSARLAAEARGVENARFLVADVQSDSLGGPYDLAFSRFGVMFFASPVAALRNVRCSLVPGGRIAFVVWRRREDNAWLYDAEVRVREMMPEVEAEMEKKGGPGAFSMASADTTTDQLLAAGFSEITLERCDVDVCVGPTLDAAVEFSMALGPAGHMLRLAGVEGERRRPEVARALREMLAAYERPNGVFAPSSTWIVSARAP
ncbi:MAG: class I SAM-dependent methyltransferase [Pseudomonadota bacterium]|nr:MAG: methyltransferase type 11 [Pseudomonadota bacterium]